jgi:hypothetical protein
VSHNEPIQTWLDGSEYTFNLNQADYPVFSKLVHNINTVVHQMEVYYMNDRIKSFNKKHEYQVLFNSSKPLDPANDPQRLYMKQIKEEHFQYFSDQLTYDVWLPLHEIQGKNYWVAYFDMDDPRPWDVSTNVVYSGGFAIGDRSAIRDPAILEYLQSYGITPGPRQCGMPLGHVIQGKELIETMPEGFITEVTVHE